MFELYFAEGTASLAPHIILEALDVRYRLIEIDISNGVHHSPEYLSINPKGQIPSLRLPTGQVLTESAAICLYLADTHPHSGFAPTIDDRDRPEFLSSLFFLSTSIQDTYKRYYYPHRYTTNTKHIQEIKTRSIEQLHECWFKVDEYLKIHGPYHLGDNYSIADIYMVMLATWFEPAEEILMTYFSVKKCFDMVVSQPGVLNCLAQQQKINVGC